MLSTEHSRTLKSPRKIFVIDSGNRLEETLIALCKEFNVQYLNLAEELASRSLEEIVARYRLEAGTWIIYQAGSPESRQIFDCTRDRVLKIGDFDTSDLAPVIVDRPERFLTASTDTYQVALADMISDSEVETYFVHAGITPIPAFVEEKYLYNGDESKRDQLPCKIVGISCYPGSSITLTVLIEDSYLFSDIPLSAIHNSREHSEIQLDLDSLIYRNCPQNPEFTMVSLPELKGSVFVTFKKTGQKIAGEYIFTLDFWQGNESCHLIKLDNGQFCFMPNHKISFGTDRQLPTWRAMKSTWNINEIE